MQVVRHVIDFACDCHSVKCRREAMSLSTVTAVLLSLLYLCCHSTIANPDAKRLFDDLLEKKNYNELMRPVRDHGNNLTVTMNLKLSQLIDVVSTLSLLDEFINLHQLQHVKIFFFTKITDGVFKGTALTSRPVDDHVLGFGLGFSLVTCPGLWS